MDPLLIMKDLVDRKKSADVKIKESKKVSLFAVLVYFHIRGISSILKVRNPINITVKVSKSYDERERREKMQREFELLHS